MKTRSKHIPLSGNTFIWNTLAPIFLAIFFLFFLTDAYASQLEIAVEDEAGPWSNKDGTGYANDVVRAAFKAVGVEAKFVVVPYARCKEMAINGLIAACFSTSPEPGIHEGVSLSDEPLFYLHVDYFQNFKKPLEIQSEKAFQKETIIGIVNGYEYPESIMKLKEQGVILEEANSEEANLEKLALGRIDAAIINHNDIKPAALMIQKLGLSDHVGYAFRSSDMGSFIGFSKKHPQGEFARSKFNEGFMIITNNGTLKRINAEWTPLQPAKMDY